ncbi:hypothetical protein EBX93_04170 [bacterium]|jgi:hypothetical protein|nr:hypothetical protein [bacterium]
MTEKKFNPGFRISIMDSFVLMVGVLATCYFGMRIWQVGLVIAFSVTHFFLFCNVFRIRRIPELIWAASFMVLVFLTIFFDFPSWFVSMMLSLVVSIVIVFLEFRQPSYHGVFWWKFNPQLENWWNSEMKRKLKPPS